MYLRWNVTDNKFVALLEAIVPGGKSVKLGGKFYDLTDKPKEYLQKSSKRFVPGRTVVAITLDDKGRVLFMSPTEEKPTVEPGPSQAQTKPASSSQPTQMAGTQPPVQSVSGSDFNVSLWQTCLNCATQIVSSSLTDENPRMKAIKMLVQADYIYSISQRKRAGEDIVKLVADEALATPAKA